MIIFMTCIYLSPQIPHSLSGTFSEVTGPRVLIPGLIDSQCKAYITGSSIKGVSAACPEELA